MTNSTSIHYWRRKRKFKTYANAMMSDSSNPYSGITDERMRLSILIQTFYKLPLQYLHHHYVPKHQVINETRHLPCNLHSFYHPSQPHTNPSIPTSLIHDPSASCMWIMYVREKRVPKGPSGNRFDSEMLIRHNHNTQHHRSFCCTKFEIRYLSGIGWTRLWIWMRINW
jgi:hypothetical protein